MAISPLLTPNQTASALIFYTLGLFAYSGVKVVVPVYYALNDTKYPVIGSFLAVGTNFLFITLTLSASAAPVHCPGHIAEHDPELYLFKHHALFQSRRLSPAQLGLCIVKICLASGIMGLFIYFLAQRLDSLLYIGIGSRLFACCWS